MGLCCCAARQPEAEQFLPDQALVVSSRTRREIEAVGEPPLLTGGPQQLFKSAEALDSSSPLEPEVVDQMLASSTSSENGVPDERLGERVRAGNSEEND